MRRQFLVAGVLLVSLPNACLVGAGTVAASAPASQPAGVAARHPGDVGIDKDPAVLLHEDFEAPQLDPKKWTQMTLKAGSLSLATDPNDVHGGRQALQVIATLGKNTGGHLFKRFDKGYERMHCRFAVKFAEDIDYTHHFVHLLAELPATPWPTGGAGECPAGDKKFSVSIEPWGQWGKYPSPGGWHFYNYWWKMKKAPDGKYWGNGLAKEAYAVPERGKWYCIEFMAKCNTPAQDDGEAGFWIDGKQMAHHTGINWRSDGKLKLNTLWLMLYVTDASAKKNKVNTVWFDDVVVATEYIGPPVVPAR
jgi:hypothetical protein